MTRTRDHGHGVRSCNQACSLTLHSNGTPGQRASLALVVMQAPCLRPPPSGRVPLSLDVSAHQSEHNTGRRSCNHACPRPTPQALVTPVGQHGPRCSVLLHPPSCLRSPLEPKSSLCLRHPGGILPVPPVCPKLAPMPFRPHCRHPGLTRHSSGTPGQRASFAIVVMQTLCLRLPPPGRAPLSLDVRPQSP